MMPRKTTKGDLGLSETELAEANSVRRDWDPRHWSLDQAGRTLLVLSLPATDAKSFVATLDKLFAASDVGELVTLYQTLPLLPFPESHVDRTREGIRTSIGAVFKAVAHFNPYPSEQLDENSWNQMILKCLFTGAALEPVTGLDRRANAPLAKMLTDYAHERWAAKRPVSPELWRCVGPFADEAGIADLQKVLSTGTPEEKESARKALKACPHPKAKAILESAS
jgi:hypothetical protein